MDTLITVSSVSNIDFPFDYIYPLDQKKVVRSYKNLEKRQKQSFPTSFFKSLKII